MAPIPTSPAPRVTQIGRVFFPAAPHPRLVTAPVAPAAPAAPQHPLPGEQYVLGSQFGRILVERGLLAHEPAPKTLWRWRKEGRVVVATLGGRRRLAVNASIKALFDPRHV